MTCMPLVFKVCILITHILMMPLNTSWAGAGLLRATSATQLTYTPVTFFPGLLAAATFLTTPSSVRTELPSGKKVVVRSPAWD